MSKFTLKSASLFRASCLSSNKCNGLKDARPNNDEMQLLLCAQVSKSSTSLSWVVGSCTRCWLVGQMNECKLLDSECVSVLSGLTCGHSWQLRNDLVNEARRHSVRAGISAGFETGCIVLRGSFVGGRQFTIRQNVAIPPWVTPIWLSTGDKWVPVCAA
jgi:hypothetical protein